MKLTYNYLYLKPKCKRNKTYAKRLVKIGIPIENVGMGIGK